MESLAYEIRAKFIVMGCVCLINLLSSHRRTSISPSVANLQGLSYSHWKWIMQIDHPKSASLRCNSNSAQSEDLLKIARNQLQRLLLTHCRLSLTNFFSSNNRTYILPSSSHPQQIQQIRVIVAYSYPPRRQRIFRACMILILQWSVEEENKPINSMGSSSTRNEAL